MSVATTADMSLLDTTAGTGSAARRRRLSPGRVGERLVGAALVALSVIPVARYLFVVAHRIGYPYELEWTEGGSVEVVHRVVLGQGIYGPPSMHFTPWPYTPVYFWVSAAVAEVTGIGFTPLRVVSFAASLVVLWLLYRMVVGETSDRVAGIVAGGVYAATFRLSGAWADIGRVDSLFLAFTLWALERSRRARTRPRRRDRGSAVISVLLHQTGRVGGGGPGRCLAPFGAPCRRRERLRHAGRPRRGFDRRPGRFHARLVPVLRLRRAAVTGLGRREPPVLLAIEHFQAVRVGGVARRGRSSRTARAGATPARGAPVAGGLLGRGGGRIVRRGVDRAPAQRGLRRRAHARLCRGRPGGGGLRCTAAPPAARGGARGGSLVLAAVLAAQLHHIDYPVGRQIPTQADARAGKHLIALIRHLPGQVLVFDHPYYGVIAGKGTVADEEAANDIERSGQSEPRRLLIRSMHRALLAPGVGAVILDNRGDERNLQGLLSADYQLLPQAAVTGNAFFPVTDLPQRPTLVFVRDRGPTPHAGGRHG